MDEKDDLCVSVLVDGSEDMLTYLQRTGRVSKSIRQSIFMYGKELPGIS